MDIDMRPAARDPTGVTFGVGLVCWAACCGRGFPVVPTNCTQKRACRFGMSLERGKALVKFAMSERNRSPSFSEVSID